MTYHNWLIELDTNLIYPPLVIIGKKTDISSEYEDLSNEIEIYRRHEPWYLHPY